MIEVQKIRAAMRNARPPQPERVRVGPALWGRAFNEIRNDPRVMELHGIPPAADLAEPNFLLEAVPIVLDTKLGPDEILVTPGGRT